MNMLWPSKCYGQLDITAQLWQRLGETRQRGRQADSHPNPGVCGAHVLPLAQAAGSLPATQSAASEGAKRIQMFVTHPSVYTQNMLAKREHVCLISRVEFLWHFGHACIDWIIVFCIWRAFFFLLFPFLWFNEWGLFLYKGKKNAITRNTLLSS